MTTNETNHFSLALEPGLDRPGSTEVPSSGDKRGNALLDKFDRALSKRVSSKREQTEAAFHELFPRLLAHQRNGRTMKELLAAFNTATQGKVCNKTFKAMFQLEARCHGEDGLRVHCISCDQPMPYRKAPPTNPQAEASRD